MNLLYSSSLLAALLFSMCISAQTIKLTGHYLDKQENPIAGALVQYFQEGDIFVDSVRTGTDGSFMVSYTLIGINTPENRVFLQKPSPNPFTGLCHFVVNVPDVAAIVVTNLLGHHVDKMILPRGGVYRASWGGRNRIGQHQPAGTYIITVTALGINTSHKVVFEGQAAQRIRAENIGLDEIILKTTDYDDRLNFTLSNTSELDLTFATPQADTIFGAITGNIGPQVTAPLTAEVHINDLEPWNLNLHFHNDDQSVYTVSDPANFAIVSDSLLIFTGSQQALYQPVITATDPNDPTLTAQLTANITIITEFQVEITGTYLDQQSNPIAEAEVTYLENGATPLSQTTTATNGQWSLAVMLNPSQTQDQLTFVKQHTTPLSLTFDPPLADTTFGIVTGNIGPQVTAPLTSEVHINDLEPWNLNLHFHNDDQSVYTVSDPANFAIVSDSLLIFTGSQQALYQPVITATDPNDPTLTAQLTANITIITEYQVEITGTYLDQQSNPIAEAEVTYLENGATPLSQTTTATNGQWSLAVLLNPNQVQDQLTFVKQHTTPLALTFDPPLADTIFGTITGNIGPQVTAPLTAEVHINDLEPWNLNLHFHNDDQSVYTVSDTDNFAIVSDSLLIFTGSQQALYQPVITATDPADPGLAAPLTANITIITEFQVEITGTYLDQQSNPIAEAEVTYMENGTNPLSQTTTATNGQWSLAVLLNPNQVQDQLTFAKPHTTPLALTFDPPLADTTFGIVTGNIGPQALMPLDATVHVDDLAPWNLNLHFHNDDQSIYTVSNTDNFAIGQDSLLVFTGTEAGNYQFTITATDPQDATLTANTSANINISDQRIFTVSGSYADQQGEPIAGAMVDYWLGGDELLAQSFTQPDGAFTMQVTTGWAPSRSNDVLSFSKTNTSYLELAFATPLADTTFGVVTGNIGPTASGSIAETHFTIEGSLQWNLNDYFHNDDQSLYTLTGSDFSIANQHWLQLPQPAPGDYNTTITATDPQDGSLTAQTTAGVQVQYTIELPQSFSIPEDSPQSILFDAADYLNPNCNLALAFSIVSQTNPQLIHLATEGSAVMISSLQPDGFGQSSAALRIENTQNGHADTLWFDVNVLPMTDIFGTIADIFDSTLVIPNATIYLFAVAPGAVTPVITDTIAVVNTNSNGYFALQLPENPEALTHYFVRISVDSEDYYPYHTWITVEPGGNDLQTDFTLIPLEAENFSMDLYRWAFRDSLCQSGQGFSTCRWREPVHNVFVINNNSYVPGYNIEPNVNTMLYNLNNILPNFAQHEYNSSAVSVVNNFEFTLQDNEIAIAWDNNIQGGGVVSLIRDGPRISKCVTKYLSSVDPNSPNNAAYNQELGTCFGAIYEPPQSLNYISVFTDPPTSNTYTPYDFNAQHIRLSRSMIHYQNFSFYPINDPEGWDWDAHPSIVDQWYNQPSSKENVFLDYKIIDFDGSIIEKGSYKYKEIPLKIMEENPMLFSAEEIAHRRLSEQQGAATVQLTTGHRPPPNAPHTTRLRHNPSQHYNTFE